MSSRVVVPEDLILPISRGDWLRVKKRLNSGENRQMLKRGLVPDGDGWRVDRIAAGTAEIVAYLLDWSLKGPDGHAILIREQPTSTVESALDAIDPESYTEILRAIETHEAAMAAERTAEKNDPDGAKASPAISPSPSAVAGASSGSANSTSTTTRS